MKTITQVREMNDAEIMTSMKNNASNMVGTGTVEQATEQAMYFTVMAQRRNMDPKPKVQAAGYGIYEQAVCEGWF